MNLKALAYTASIFIAIILGISLLSKQQTAFPENNNNVESVEEKQEPSPSQTPMSSDKKGQKGVSKITYHTFNQVDGFPFFHGLYATYNNKRYNIITGDDQDNLRCISIFDERDFDGDGLEDALIVDIVSCGGNCCSTSLFFCTYSKNGKFIETEEFGSTWDDPIIERWNGKWSVKVVSEHEGIDITEMSEITERYILKNKKAVRVEYEDAKPIQAILEMTSESFTEREKRIDVGKKIAYDLDNDGYADIISGEYWHRWGRMNLKIKFADGKEYIGGAVKRIGILPTRTRGVNDIVCDFDQVMVWDGKEYVDKDRE